VSADNVADLLQAGGPWALLLSVLVAGLQQIRTGGLVPRSTLDLMVAQYEARITETARQAEDRINESREREQAWRSAAEADRQAAAIQGEQTNKLLVLGETTVAILRALPTQRT